MNEQPQFRPTSLLHGADYNPEQWKHVPGIWDADMLLFNEAAMNCATIGVFSWAELESAEGVYSLEWMDEIMDRLHANGQRVILATPSGAKPNWMAAKYPEICRCNSDGSRQPQEYRHNHCMTSPIYREKVLQMNTRLAMRYGQHPAVLAWHISNEFGGYCYCPLCWDAFRGWLQKKYATLDALNDAWWTRFWSHRFTDWSQIVTLDKSIHGLCLDWRRFMTEQVADFIRHESAPLRQHSPLIPTTANLMGGFTDYDYQLIADAVDFVSWDSYPRWHGQVGEKTPHWHLGLWTTFYHDQMRGMKPGLPFYLMECTPSQVNWMDNSPLKRPGMHRLSCLLAVSRGSQGSSYFQFRASRGSWEKYHGAVVWHDGTSNTRVFRDVRNIGQLFEKLGDVIPSVCEPEVAVIWDQENCWSLDLMQSPINSLKNYTDTVVDHYTPFWQHGVGVDVVDQRADFTRYKIVVAPMLHLLMPDTAARLTAYVEAGGVLVTTYLSGYVGPTDLCFQGGFPGPLRPMLGVWAEELDALPDFREVPVQITEDVMPGLSGCFFARDVCELIHAESAEVLATYDGEFYKGTPAITRKVSGSGVAYHIAARMGADFHAAFTKALIHQHGVRRVLETELPAGVTAQSRVHKDGREWIFLLNTSDADATVVLPAGTLTDGETGQAVSGSIAMPAFASRIFQRVSA